MVLPPTDYRRTIWSGLGMILIGLAMAVLGYFGSVEEKEIKTHGTDTTAIITNKGSDNDRDQARYFLNFKFSDLSGAQHEGTRNVDRGLWEAHPVGGPIDVRYLPSNPKAVRLAGEITDPNEMFYWLGGLGGLMALGGVVFILYARHKRPGTAHRQQEFTGASR